jgi:hypothetical protein
VIWVNPALRADYLTDCASGFITELQVPILR